MANSEHFEAVNDVWTTVQHQIFSTAQYRPRLTASIILVILTLICTRLITTVQFHRQRARVTRAVQPISPPVPPFSIPYLANALYYADLVPNIKRIFDRYPSLTAFTFHIFGSKHHVILAPSMVHQMATQKTLIPKFTLMPFILRNMENVWGDKDQILRNMPVQKLDHVHSFLSTMMHPTFLNSGVPRLTAALGAAAPDMISFSRSVVDQPEWERAARVVTTSPDSAVAELFTLIRHFAAVLTTDIFFSPDLIANNPNIISDLYYMDTRFEALFAGFPTWLPSNRGPAAARDRVIAAMREQVCAFWEYDNGRDPGSKWSRIGEMCEPMANRIRGCAADNDFDDTLPPHKRGMKSALCNAAILWSLQVNATATIFWVVWYANANPTLLSDLRAEIAPYISTTTPTSSFPSGIREKPTLKIDSSGLRANAKLLLACLHEVLRMETFSLTYKSVTDDFVVSESPEDAAMHGRPGNPKTYACSKGDYVVVPHTLHHYDDRYFPEPYTFNPRRFWVPADAARAFHQPVSALSEKQGRELDPEKVEVTYLTSHPWGGGAQLCKGKKFAEFEVMVISAAILYLWDLTPVKTDWKGEMVEEDKWTHPGRANKSATARVGREVWVKVGRREGAW